MSLADLDRVIAKLELAAMEPTTIGDTPVVIVDVNGDALRDALSTLRSMRQRAVEGWAEEIEVHDPDDPYVRVYRSRSHPHIAEDEATTGVAYVGVLLIPAERSET